MMTNMQLITCLAFVVVCSYQLVDGATVGASYLHSNYRKRNVEDRREANQKLQDTDLLEQILRNLRERKDAKNKMDSDARRLFSSNYKEVRRNLNQYNIHDSQWLREQTDNE